MNAMQFGGALALSLLVAACREQNAATENRQAADSTAAAQAGQVYSARGRVTSIAGDQVAIAHGPVNGIGWPAMTMTFRAGSADITHGVSAGDQVSFAFRQDGSAYVLTSLQKR